MKVCENLDEVRESIDAIDRRIVGLLSEKSGYVRQAARFKNTAGEVEAPKRVEEVVSEVRGLYTEHGMSPDIAERAYRAMIAGFIDYEMQEHREGRA